MKKNNDNGRISVKIGLSATTIYLPSDKLPKLIGFLRHQIFDKRVDNRFIKDMIKTKKIIFERVK